MVEFLTKKCRLWKDGEGALDITLSFMAKANYTGLNLTVDVSFARMHYERPGFLLTIGTDAYALRDDIREALGGWMMEGLEGSFVQEYEQGLARMYRRYALAPHVLMLVSSLMVVEERDDAMPQYSPIVLMLEPWDILGVAHYGDRKELREILTKRVACVGS